MKLTTRILMLGLSIGGLLLASMPAKADFFDNFDSYNTTTDFQGAWTTTVGTGFSLNSTNVSSPNSVWNPTTNAATSRHQMPTIDALNVDFSFDFYDSTTANARDFGQMYSKNGNWANATQNILRIGKYNTITTSKYYGYIFLSSGVILGDGATSLTSGYFALGGAADRSVGWHEARITGEPDTANTGMALYKFYIDGVLGGSISNARDFDFDFVVLGSGATSPNALLYDNVQVTSLVPEPSALGLGLLALAFVRAKRR